MLQFFRINDPYRLIFVFLILVCIRSAWLIYGLPLSLPELKWLLVGERLGSGFTMYKDLYDHTGPLSAFIYKSLDILFGRSRWAHMVVSTFLIILQAGILNNILLKNKAYNENSYLPSFLYVILMSAVMDFFALSPQLMALTFILLSLNNIFRRIDNVATDELFLYSGIYLGVATLFYFPAVIFFVIFFMSFVLFSSAILRRLLLLIYGAFAVLVVVWAYFYWFEAAWDFINDFFIIGATKPKIFYLSYLDLLKVAGFFVGVLLLSLTILVTARVTNYQLKMQQVMLSFMVAGGIVLVINRDLMTADMVFFVPSATFFLVHYFIGLKRRVWKFLMPYLIVFGLLLYPTWWMLKAPLKAMTVSQVEQPEPGRRLMGIGVENALYQHYTIAGPFLDDHVSRRKLGELDYYDEASEIYEALEKSQADVIIDRWGIADQIFYRFPEFGKRYQSSGDGTYRLKAQTSSN